MNHRLAILGVLLSVGTFAMCGCRVIVPAPLPVAESAAPAGGADPQQPESKRKTSPAIEQPPEQPQGATEQTEEEQSLPETPDSQQPPPDESPAAKEHETAPVMIDWRSDARLLELIETTDDPVVKRVLAAQLSTATPQNAGGHPIAAPPLAAQPQKADRPASPPGQRPVPARADTPDAGPQRLPPVATGHLATPSSANASDGRDRDKLQAKASSVALASASDQDLAPRQWQELLDETIAALEAQLRDPDNTGREKNDDAAARREALLRLLYLVADQRQQAVRAIDQLDEAEQEFWKELLYGLIVYFDEREMPLRERRMTLALQHLRRAVDQLSMVADLEVRNVVFCTRVDSYGRYNEFDKYEFRPDQEVLLYVEVDNFTVEQRSTDGRYETALQGSYEIRDLAQQKVAEHSFLLEREVCRNRRRDFFIPYRMYMPRIQPGRYALQVTIQDAKSKRIGQSAPVEFTIKR